MQTKCVLETRWYSSMLRRAGVRLKYIPRQYIEDIAGEWPSDCFLCQVIDTQSGENPRHIPR